MPQHDHNHSPKKSDGPKGYLPNKSVTRYELATTLAQLLAPMDRAALQPSKSALERKPGRKGSLTPNPKKAQSYTDIPSGHWAKTAISLLQARRLTLVKGSVFGGEKPLTGDEVAVWVDGAAAWIEGRVSRATGVRDLVQGGYIPQTHSLVAGAKKPVTATQVADLLVPVISRTQERLTTITPDSKHTD